MKIKEVLDKLREDGWYIKRFKGSHRQLAHPTKLGIVTVAGKNSDELAKGTYNSILRQSGLK